MKICLSIAILTLSLPTLSHAYSFLQIPNKLDVSQNFSNKKDSNPDHCATFTGKWNGMCKDTTSNGASKNQNLQLEIFQRACDGMTVSGDNFYFGEISSKTNKWASVSVVLDWISDKTALKISGTTLATTVLACACPVNQPCDCPPSEVSHTALILNGEMRLENDKLTMKYTNSSDNYSVSTECTLDKTPNP